MLELEPSGLSPLELSSSPQKPPPVELSARTQLNGQIYPTQVLVQPPVPPALLHRPSMANFIRLTDDSGRATLTADDLKQLNHPAAVLANILGNTYPFTEMAVLFPDSQAQSLHVSRWLKSSHLLGEVDSLFDDDRAGHTLSDGFYYEYSGTGWKSRPTPLIGRLFLKGTPHRPDMQLSLTRTPDYRVPSDLLHQYFLTLSIAARAIDFTVALEKYSQGAIQLEIDLPPTP